MPRRWTMLCLLLFLTLASTQISVVVPGTPALADNGHGNDKKDKDKEKEKDKDKGNGNAAVEPAAPYRVEVSCGAGEAAGQTACTFTGIAPEGAKKVGHVDLPATEICTTVLGGDAEYVDPDPNTGVTGYKSKGSGGVFSLILEGDVATGGTASYWVKAGNGVFPATGPGLVCGEEAQLAADATAGINVTGTLATPATAEATASSGAVAVYTYACTADAATAAIDWFSACQPGVSGVRFTLSMADPGSPENLGDGETDGRGAVRFESLTPGTYTLDAPDAVWCHAESDNVNEHGELVVTSGADVSVWIFLCGSDSATAP